MDRKYGCVLLAGGSGSRMGGRNKAELEYDRVKFAERIEAELSKLGIPCYISAAAYEQDVPEGWALVRVGLFVDSWGLGAEQGETLRQPGRRLQSRLPE